MKNKQKNIIAVILLLFIAALAGVSVFVAYRISTQERVAPTAPESRPAAGVSCTSEGGVCRVGTCPSGEEIVSGTDCEVTKGSVCCAAPWTPSDSCKATFTVSQPVCEERPECLDNKPPCLISEPPGGWCPYLACPDEKKAYRDSADNKAGLYDLGDAKLIAAGGTVSPNEQFIYAVKYSDGMPSKPVDQATLEDTLDPRLEYIDASPVCSHLSGKVTCNITKAMIQAGGTIAFRVKVKANATAGTLNNTANISSAFTSAQNKTGNNTTTTECTNNLNISVVPTVNVSCKQKEALNESGTAPISSVGANQIFTYTMDLINSGNTSSEIILTDPLASSLIFVDSVSGCTFGSADKLVTCKTSLGAGETKKITFRVRTSTASLETPTINNTASVSAAGNALVVSQCSKTISFSTTTPTATPTATGTPTTTGTPTVTPTGTGSPTPTATGTPTSTPTTTGAATPTATPTTPTGTSTPTTAVGSGAGTATPTSIAAGEALPATGIFDIPGAAMFGGGLLLAILGILLAL